MSKEPRSKQLGVFVPPSLSQKIKKIVYVKRTSVNQIVNAFLEQFVKENQDSLQEYEKLQKEE